MADDGLNTTPEAREMPPRLASLARSLHRREQTAATRKIVDEEIKPVTDDVKRMRIVGLGIAGLLGFAFTALGITLATVGEGVVQVVRAWLGILS